MPGTDLSHNADEASRDAGNLAAAATEMMWTIALATTRTAIASTARGFELWWQTLRVAPPAWPLFANPFGCGQNAAAMPDAPEPSASAAQEAPQAGVTSAGAPTFASYRSSGGHAAAQVSRRP